MGKLIVANWKENPRTEKLAQELFRATAGVKSQRKTEVVVCPPLIYLEKIAEMRRRSKKTHVALGAQDAFWREKGSYTSEVGPKMLKALGVSYVIVGHSERRRWLKETDTMINKKMKLVLRDGLTAILCVGEPLAVRKKGMAAARRFVAGQLKKDLAGIPRMKHYSRRIVIAYEPIWAIGTGRFADARDVGNMAEFIKASLFATHRLKPRVLYGGSVSSKNAGDYVHYKSIDGALVGGASLNAKEFKKIIKQ